MWKPITAASDIPAIGKRERYNVDFKAKLVADSFEIAKDVAAFSNTFGGTLIIGGAGGDRVEKYLPVDSAAAHDVGRLVEEAVRDRCRPAPFIDIFELPHEGGLLVAVNVCRRMRCWSAFESFSMRTRSERSRTSRRMSFAFPIGSERTPATSRRSRCRCSWTQTQGA